MQMIGEKVVVYATDDGYADVTGISILSLCENNRNKLFRIYILDVGITEENKQKISNVAEKFGNTCVYCDVRDRLESFKELNRNIHFGAFARLFIGEILPVETDRALYIDADTLINGDIALIYEINIDRHMMAGVPDIFLPISGRGQIGFSDNELYINSGILYINVKQWRESDMPAKCLEFLRKNPQAIFHDQDAINMVCRGKIVPMSLKYNVIGLSAILPFSYARWVMDSGNAKLCCGEEYNEAVQKPVIIHFAGSFAGKPWMKECRHPYQKQYESYKRRSPWRDQSLRERKYAQNKFVGIYKKSIEKVCMYFWEKKNYTMFVILYRMFYDKTKIILAKGRIAGRRIRGTS